MKRKYLSSLVLSSALALSLTTVNAQEKQSPVKEKQVNSKGVPTMVEFNKSAKLSLSQAKSILKQQLKYDSNTSYKRADVLNDDLGMVHETYQQYYRGVPVAFATYKVHAKNNTVGIINGDFAKIKTLNVKPSLTADAALRRATAKINAKSYAWETGSIPGYSKPEGELMVLPALEGISEKNHLVYRFDIYSQAPLYRANVYVDAQSGKVVFEDAIIKHIGKIVNHNDHNHTQKPTLASEKEESTTFLADVKAKGTSLYNGTVSFYAGEYNGGYRLQQSTTGGGITTKTLRGSRNKSGGGYDITSNSSTFGTSDVQKVGVAAHWGAENTYNYFFDKHGRKSYNNRDARITSYIKYDTGVFNAFWDGSSVTYGDGGSSASDLVSVDICSHEITHGVTGNSAGLIYRNESGALNESFSDIFGEAVQKFATGTNDWLTGQEIGRTIRSLKNPNDYNHPDTYKGNKWYTGSGDNGGVHINSGVQNHWFYLLSVGKKGTNDKGNQYDVRAIGMEKAAKIAYRNLTVYLSANSNYPAAQSGALKAAADLYGKESFEYAAAANAWYACGIGSSMDYPDANEAPTAPQNLKAADVVQTSLTLNWDASSDSDGRVVGYEVYQDGKLIGEPTSTSFNVTGLTKGTSYKFSVKAKDDKGATSDFSTEITVETPDVVDTEAPAEPRGLAASNVKSRTLTLTWDPSRDNVAVTGYEIFKGREKIGESETTSFDVTGLTPETEYRFSVKAFDAAGNKSTLSREIAVTTTASTGDDSPPTAPRNLEANVSGSDVSLSWVPSRDNVGVVRYDIFQDGVKIGESTSTSFNVNGLSSGTYKFTVKAYDAEGNESKASNEVTVEIDGKDAEAPSNPTNLVATRVSGTEFRLNWNESKDNVGVTGYNVYLDGSLLGTSDDNEALLQELAPNTSYSVYVEAYDAAGNVSGASNTVTFETGGNGGGDTQAPSAPSYINGRRLSATSVYIYWGRSSDNVGVVGYNVYSNGYKLGTVNRTSATISQLYGSRYRVYVTAVDAAGNESSASPVLTIYNSYGATSSLAGDQASLTDGDASFSIYPNPANDLININGLFDANFKIVNFAGKVVKSGKANGNEINISNLTSGIYFIEATDGENTFSSKFVKN